MSYDVTVRIPVEFDSAAEMAGWLERTVVNEMKKTAEGAGTEDSPAIVWTQEALKRLENIPEFVRPMAVQGIEKMALDMECFEIDEKVLDEAKSFFGM